MLLSQALRLSASPRLALVGAGGKTTALFMLARELVNSGRKNSKQAGGEARSSVLLTTTTHLGVSQLSFARRHVQVNQVEELIDLEREIPEGLVLVTGPKVEGEADRVSGLEQAALERLLGFAVEKGLPLLIEADGSRLRPIKAPAGHEPAVPDFVDTVVVVAGLSGLGKPLDDGWVHRPELFSELSGLPMGAEISAEALVNVLCHPRGGLKGIPPNARRIALLNQADTEALRSQAEGMANRLMPPYHSVVVSALAAVGESDLDSSSRKARVYAAYEPVGGIILAAGGSSRYGRPKQLLTWRSEPFVRQVARKALQAGLRPVVVVTGFMPDGVRAAIRDLEVTEVYNPLWEQGQSTSLKAGLRGLPFESGAAVFLLSDMPQVPVDLIQALIKAHSQTLLPLAAPIVAGRRANPVLFDRSTFPALLTLQGDRGGRGLFNEPDRFPTAWVPWEDTNILLDVDTPDDYTRLLELE